jgi:hypothetical protein
MLDSAGLDVLEYDTRNQRYRIHFSKDEIQKHERLLKEILGRALWAPNNESGTLDSEIFLAAVMLALA